MCDPSPPGFRFWLTDALVLVGVALATWHLLADLGSVAWALPLVTVHFFLFCNVFRVRRRYELIWAALFLANTFSCLALGGFSWGRILLVQTPFTALLVFLEARSPAYHGIFWKRINPRGQRGALHQAPRDDILS